MKKTFQEWYSPDGEELKRLWLNGTVVLDSNVLLDLYQYPPSTLAEFFDLLERIGTRLWLSYQAGVEYQRNRQRSLPQQRSVLERLIRELEGLSQNLETVAVPEYHPVLDLPGVETCRLEVKTALESVIDKVRVALKDTPEFKAGAILGGEPIRDRVTALFDGRVGSQLSASDLEAIYKEGAQRYAREQPPGYKDVAKDEPDRYADLVIWKDLIAHQKTLPEGKRGAILVTNDRKEDWWLRKDKLLLGPRPELAREFLVEVGDRFFMYTPADFLRAAPTYFAAFAVSPETIAEVERVSQATPVVDILRAQRMILPPSGVRVRALASLYDALVGGKATKAGDLKPLIESFGEPFTSIYVEAPLFFSLVNESYGPITALYDPSLRLRDRTIQLGTMAGTKEEFVHNAHAAWLAQALYRVRLEDFPREELLLAFFGEEYDSDAQGLLAAAQRFAAADIENRAGGSRWTA